MSTAVGFEPTIYCIVTLISKVSFCRECGLVKSLYKIFVIGLSATVFTS